MKVVHKLFLFILFFLCFHFRLKASDQENWQSLYDSLRAVAGSNPTGLLKDIDDYLSHALSDKDSLKYGKLLNVRAIAKRNSGNYAGSIVDFNKAFDVFNLMGNRDAAAGSLNSLGTVLIKTARYKEAENYLLQALNMVRKDDSVMMNIVTANLGVVYDYSGRTQEAIAAYKRASNYIHPDDFNSLGSITHNIGVCYAMLKDFKLASAYELKALEYQQKSQSQDLLARIAISLGGVYLDNNDTKSAIKYLKLGGEAAQKINNAELLEEYYKHIIDYYVMIKDSKNALVYYEKLNELKTKMYNEDNSKNIAEAEAKFNVTLKDKEIENLRISKTLSDLRMERNKLIRNTLAGIALISLVLLYVMFHNYQLRKKNFSLLAREKQLIENEKKNLERNNELLENENILARFEILKSQVSPHFLFNSLNALSFLIESEPAKAVAFTDALSKLYRTVLELKDRHLITLAEELDHVEAYFFLQRTRFGGNLTIDKEIETDKMGLKLPPFSIQMAVENAINHNMISDKNPLAIKIYCQDNMLIIENNLQVKINTVKSTSIGISNIKARYSFFTDDNPEFIKTESSFIVKLPLLAEAG